MKKNFFSNILLLVASVSIFASCQTSNKIDLFNGKDLSNWGIFVKPDAGVTPESVFYVNEGVIECTGKPLGYMYTKEQYSNFNLHVEWRWADGIGTNSGIFLLLQEPGKLWPNTIECQLCKEKAGDFVLIGGSDLAEFKLKEGEKRPGFPSIAKQKPSNEKPIGEWNKADISCVDGKITVTINGELQNIGTEPIYKSGHIALQSEGGPIQFKNVTIEKL